MSSLGCPRCGHGNDGEARFCGACGGKLVSAPPVSVGAAPSLTPAPSLAARSPEPSSALIPASSWSRAWTAILLVDLALAVGGAWLWLAAGRISQAQVTEARPVVAPGEAPPLDAGLDLPIADAAAAPPSSAAAPAVSRPSLSPPIAVAPPDAAPPPIDAAPPPIDAAPPPIDAARPPPPPPPHPAVDATVAMPGMAELPNLVTEQVRASDTAVANCRRDAGPGSGSVDIAFAVMPTGEVSRVSVRQSSTGSDALAACLTAVVSSWRLPALAIDGPIEFWHSFAEGR